MNPPKPDRPRLRKREILFAVTMGVIAASGAAIMLDDDGGGSSGREDAAPTEQTYQVRDFERISSIGPQDVEVTLGDAFSVRAEGFTADLEVVVENGELIIRPRNGVGSNFDELDSTMLYVTLPKLTRMHMNGSGEISLGQIAGDKFEAVIEGFPGEMRIEGLQVDEAEFTISGVGGSITAAGTAGATRVTINGIGEVQAGELQSQRAAVTVNGPGEVELAVQDEANVSVQGPGEVDIDGPARCTVSTSGNGTVSCGDQE
jgi:hypothetical protein